MGANRQKRQHKERSPRLPGSAAARVCSPHPHPFPQSPPAPLQLRSRRCAGTAAIHPRLRSRARLRPPARPEGGVGGDPCNGHRAERFAVNNFLLGEGGCRDRCPTMELRSPPPPPHPWPGPTLRKHRHFLRAQTASDPPGAPRRLRRARSNPTPPPQLPHRAQSRPPPSLTWYCAPEGPIGRYPGAAAEAGAGLGPLIIPGPGPGGGGAAAAEGGRGLSGNAPRAAMAGPGLGVGAAPARAVYSEAAAPGAEATRGMRSHAPDRPRPLPPATPPTRPRP